MAEEKKSFTNSSNWAIVVAIGVCLLAMSAGPLTITVFSVYRNPIAQACGVTIVEAGLCTSLQGWVMAGTAIVWGALYSKVKKPAQFKLCNICIGALGTAGFLICSLLGPTVGIWAYWVGYVIVGLGGGCFAVMIPMLMISNWFAPKIRGKAYGICMATGVCGGFVYPPLFTAIMQSSNLGTAYFVHACVWGVLTLIPSIFIFKKRPEDTLPFGVKTWEELDEGAAAEGAEGSKYGFPVKKFIVCVPFWILCLATVCQTVQPSIQPNLVGATGVWMSAANHPDAANYAMVGAFMISISQIGATAGKLLVGIVNDWIGAGGACATFFILPGIAMLIWVFVPASYFTLYAGAILFGSISGSILVGKALVLRSMFGERTYPLAQSITGAINTGISGFVTPALAAAVLAFGYNWIFVFGAFAMIVTALLYFIAAKMAPSMRKQWVDVDGNPMPENEAAAA